MKTMYFGKVSILLSQANFLFSSLFWYFFRWKGVVEYLGVFIYALSNRDVFRAWAHWKPRETLKVAGYLYIWHALYRVATKYLRVSYFFYSLLFLSFAIHLFPNLVLFYSIFNVLQYEIKYKEWWRYLCMLIFIRSLHSAG